MGTGEVTRYLGKYDSDRVEKAALLAPIPPYLLKTSDNPQGVDKNVFNEIMDAIKDDRPAFLTQFLHDFYNLDVFEGKLISKQANQHSWNVAARSSPIGTFECVKAWLTDFREDVKNINVPTLVLQGTADRILPIDSTGRRLPEAIKNCKYIEVENAPHCLIWTHADQINNELLEFLS